MYMWKLWCPKKKKTSKQMGVNSPRYLANRICFRWRDRKNTHSYSHVSYSLLMSAEVILGNICKANLHNPCKEPLHFPCFKVLIQLKAAKVNLESLRGKKLKTARKCLFYFILGMHVTCLE